MSDIFCKIIAGQIPSQPVYQDDRCYVIRDIAPQAPQHLLVLPRQHIARLSESTEAHEALIGHLMVVAGRIGREQCPQGFRIVINDGEQGCQTVFHLHVHVIGGRQMGWPPG